MLHCKPKNPSPCFHYDHPHKQAELNEFLIANGGQAARFDTTGTAHILTIVKGDNRFVYLEPNAWIRCVTPGQFTCMNPKTFEREFELVDDDMPLLESLKGMTEATANNLASNIGSLSIRECYFLKDSSSRSKFE